MERPHSKYLRSNMKSILCRFPITAGCRNRARARTKHRLSTLAHHLQHDQQKPGCSYQQTSQPQERAGKQTLKNILARSREETNTTHRACVYYLWPITSRFDGFLFQAAHSCPILPLPCQPLGIPSSRLFFGGSICLARAHRGRARAMYELI